MKTVVIIAGLIMLVAAFGASRPSADDERLAKMTPDQRMCVDQMRTKYLSMTPDAVAELPDTYRDSFAWDVLACVGRREAARRKMGGY